MTNLAYFEQFTKVPAENDRKAMQVLFDITFERVNYANDIGHGLIFHYTTELNS